MPRCQACGRRGLFMRLDPRWGLCPDCARDYAGQSGPLSRELMQGLNQLRACPPGPGREELAERIARMAARLEAICRSFGVEPGEQLKEILKTHRPQDLDQDGPGGKQR